MTLVVKIGGGAAIATASILAELATRVKLGEQVVLLHGGSALTNALSQQLGQPVRMITSPGGMVSRYTDGETLRIYAMAVAGQINTATVADLQRLGVNAFGLTGVDGRLLLAKRKSAVRSLTPQGRTLIVRDDYTGQIEQVNETLLRQLLAWGYTPVIAPLALSHEGERLNVDGDRAAAAVAAALGAEALIIITNVPGLLTDPQDETTLISSISADQLDSFMGYARGRMRTKLLAAQQALQAGVDRVFIGGASLANALAGHGTTLVRVGEGAAPELKQYEQQRTGTCGAIPIERRLL
jgi:[amino group carrier protein]-L-2-aminoadipate 6-kinase